MRTPPVIEDSGLMPELMTSSMVIIMGPIPPPDVMPSRMPLMMAVGMETCVCGTTTR
jgi:hypothetical protein